MRYSILVMAAILSGCVTEHPVTLPNGQSGYSINCPGTSHDIGDCMNEAARICGGKYEILDRDSESAGGAVAPAGQSAVFMNGIHRTMIVRCGAH